MFVIHPGFQLGETLHSSWFSTASRETSQGRLRLLVLIAIVVLWEALYPADYASFEQCLFFFRIAPLIQNRATTLCSPLI